ncbi:MAG: GNAT family N-acetyltransferase [Pseudomonadota bacterium]
MAELVNMAGDGMPFYLWSKSAQGDESPWAVGEARARRESGGFSYRNTVVREHNGAVVAALIGYPLPFEPEPVDYEELPPMFVPLQRLEDRVSGTWYVNVLATYPDFRGRGAGAALLGIADRLAAETKRKGLSLIVSDANPGAQRLYERHGFEELATEPMVKDAWETEGSQWVLMKKPQVPTTFRRSRR